MRAKFINLLNIRECIYHAWKSINIVEHPNTDIDALMDRGYLIPVILDAVTGEILIDIRDYTSYDYETLTEFVKIFHIF